MHLYTIQHTDTGEFLTDKLKGGSWWDGEPALGTPRMFKTEGQAKAWVTNWLKGVIKKEWDSYGEFHRLYYEPRPLRKRTDLRILPVTLTIGT